jgi:hypothetical protein
MWSSSCEGSRPSREREEVDLRVAMTEGRLVLAHPRDRAAERREHLETEVGGDRRGGDPAFDEGVEQGIGELGERGRLPVAPRDAGRRDLVTRGLNRQVRLALHGLLKWRCDRTQLGGDRLALLEVRPRHDEPGRHDRATHQRLVNPRPAPRHGAGVRVAHDVVVREDKVTEGSKDGRPVLRGVGELGREDRRFERMEPELERGDDPEVPPSTAEAPEQLGLVRRAGPHDAAVGEDHLRRQEVVAGQTESPRQVAAAPSEREPPDTRVTHHPAGRAEAEPLRLGIQVPDEGSASDGGGPGVGIDRDRTHPTQVDHDPSVGGGMAGDAVASSADRDLQT